MVDFFSGILAMEVHQPKRFPLVTSYQAVSWTNVVTFPLVRSSFQRTAIIPHRRCCCWLTHSSFLHTGTWKRRRSLITWPNVFPSSTFQIYRTPIQLLLFFSHHVHHTCDPRTGGLIFFSSNNDLSLTERIFHVHTCRRIVSSGRSSISANLLLLSSFRPPARP